MTTNASVSPATTSGSPRRPQLLFPRPGTSECCQTAETLSTQMRRLLNDGNPTTALREVSPNRKYKLVGVRTEEPLLLVSRIRAHADAYRRRVSSSDAAGSVWLLAPADGQWLESAFAQDGLPTFLAVARDVDDLRLVPCLRASIDELLEAGTRRGWTGFRDLEDLQVASRVEALLEIAARQPELVAGPLRVLLETPSNHVFARTLLAWFSHDRDTAATAASLHLHVNTVRYRIRRAQKITGLDVSDWDQRLLAEVQLRLWAVTPGATRSAG